MQLRKKNPWLISFFCQRIHIHYSQLNFYIFKNWTCDHIIIQRNYCTNVPIHRKPTVLVLAIWAIDITFYRLNPSLKSISSLKWWRARKWVILGPFCRPRESERDFVLSLSCSSGPPLNRPIASDQNRKVQ